MKASIIVEEGPEFVPTLSLTNSCEDMETDDHAMFYEIDGCVALSPPKGEIHLDRTQVEALIAWLKERSSRMVESV